MACHVCGHLKYLLNKRWLYFPPSVRLTLPAFTSLPAVCVVSILLVAAGTVSVSAVSALSSCPTIATSLGYTNHTGQSSTEHWDHLLYQDMSQTWTQVNIQDAVLIVHFTFWGRFARSSSVPPSSYYSAPSFSNAASPFRDRAMSVPREVSYSYRW